MQPAIENNTIYGTGTGTAARNGNFSFSSSNNDFDMTPDDRVVPKPSDDFVITPYVQELTERALAYLSVGLPIHLAGPPGAGKTTIAFHIAAQIGRNVTLINGDDEFAGSDLIGRDAGYSKSSLVDNYIRSVVKTEEKMNPVWLDHRLTTACVSGSTLIYDEFSRSRPEANNAFLSILEEKILILPVIRSGGETYLEVHPDFRVIFTSNPEEYAGVHRTQDALMDRVISIQLTHYDRETEVRICMAKSGLNLADTEKIVDIVRELRGLKISKHWPSLRASLAIAKILGHFGGHASMDNLLFMRICQDILKSDISKVFREGNGKLSKDVEDAIKKVCGTSA